MVARFAFCDTPFRDLRPARENGPWRPDAIPGGTVDDQELAQGLKLAATAVASAVVVAALVIAIGGPFVNRAASTAAEPATGVVLVRTAG